MKYRLVLLDLDGTTLDACHRIVPKNLAAVRAARAAGVTVSIATGRGPRTSLRYYTELGITGPAVFHNGALVYEPGIRRVIASKDVPYEVVKKYLELAADFPDANMSLQTIDQFFVQFMDPWVENMTAWAGTAPEWVGPLDDRIPDQVLKMGARMGMEEAKAFRTRVEEELGDELIIKRTNPDWSHLDAFARGAGKGWGAARLAEFLGIRPDEVLAIGDEENDLEMLRFAGLGIAMGNATPEAKQAADRVGPSNEEAGVAQILEKYVLQ